MDCLFDKFGVNHNTESDLYLVDKNRTETEEYCLSSY